MIYNTHGNEIKGCSAEGHVKTSYLQFEQRKYVGVSPITKKELKKVVGGEDMAISASEVFMSDKNKKGILGKYANARTCSIAYPQVKKIASLKGHLWGL